jgi:hypothetical protein
VTDEGGSDKGADAMQPADYTTLWRLGCRWNNNILTDLKEIGGSE